MVAKISKKDYQNFFRKEKRNEGLRYPIFHNAILNNSLKNGDLETIKLFHTKGIYVPKKSLKLAGKHLHVIKWLHHSGYEFSFNCLTLFVLGNRVDVMKFLIDEGYEYPILSTDFKKLVCSDINVIPMLDLIKWRHLQLSILYYGEFYTIIKKGKLDLIKYLNFEKEQIIQISWMFDLSIKYNQIEIIKYLINKYTSHPPTLFRDCLKFNRFKICHYLVKNKFIPLEKNIYNIFDPIDPNFVEWLIVSKCVFRPNIVEVMVKRNYVESLRMLYSLTRIYKASYYDMMIAIEKGYLEIVKILHSYNEFSNSIHFISKAVHHNHFEIVKFLVGTGDYICTTDALQSKNKKIVNWLYINCFPYYNYKNKLKKYSELVNPSETICMVCHDEMKSDTLVKEFQCHHFVCEDCDKVENCPYQCRKDVMIVRDKNTFLLTRISSGALSLPVN